MSSANWKPNELIPPIILKRWVLAERKYRRERLRMVRRSAAARQTPRREQKLGATRKADSGERRPPGPGRAPTVAGRRPRELRPNSGQLLGPDLPVQVEVPAYENAFVILLNWFLELLYAMIWARRSGYYCWCCG